MCLPSVTGDGEVTGFILIPHVTHHQLITAIGKPTDVERAVHVGDGTLDEFLALHHTDIHKLQGFIALFVYHFPSNHALCNCNEGTSH